ncbi:MAG: hypothetical protein WBG54_02975 [Acidobacteriaceae bacterium]
MPDPNGRDAWESLSALMRSVEPHIEESLAYCLEHPPDPQKHPATTALIAEYVKRLQLYLMHSRSGVAGMREQASKHPHLVGEIQEIEKWIKQRKPGTVRQPLPEEHQDLLGDWLVEHVDHSYSKARKFVTSVAKSVSSRGAPNKRPQTLKMLDARIANRWSYRALAAKMCDCGGEQHNEYCSERIRKRIKELEAFLKNFGIALKYPGEK